ncbi:MAG TPA: hypothetical protein VFZ64_09215 [Nocardioidaceae bacterium]
MQHAHRVDDVPHVTRTVLAGVLVILVVGLVLGWVAGIALTRAFEAAHVDEIGRQIFGVDGEDPVRADTLRP